MSLITKWVRKLTSWAWVHEVSVCNGLADLDELHAQPGSMEIHIKNKPAVQQYMAHCFAALVASSPNYTELKFDMMAKSEEDPEWVTVTVKKGIGLTPHTLRVQAEVKVSEMEAERDQLKKENVILQSKLDSLSSSPGKCLHMRAWNDKGTRTCVDCGTILTEEQLQKAKQVWN